MGDVVIVSFHEKGFWQADLYLGASEWTRFDWENGVVPDAFFTLKKEQNFSEVVLVARRPKATKMMIGTTDLSLVSQVRT